MVLAVTQFGASLAGLIRDRVLAQTFPPGVDQLDVVSVYIAAFRPSDLLFQMLIMSAVGTVLVPMLAKRHVEGGSQETATLLGAAMGVGTFVFGAVAVATAAVLPYIAPWMVDFQGEQLKLYVNFGRIVLLSDLLMVVGSVTGQYLITIQRYWVYGLTPIVYSIGTILGTLWLTPLVGPYGPILGTVLGAILYACWRIAAVCWSGVSLRFRLWHADIREIGWLMVPRMLALGSLQLQLLFFDAFASGLGLGSVTVNAYARNFQSVAVGVIGIALAQSIFSPLSQAHAKGEHGRFAALLKKGGALVVISSIASSVGLVVLAPLAAWLVKITGTPVYSIFLFALTIYAFSIPFESLNHLLLRAFYARKDSLTPAVVSSLSAVIAVTTAWILLPRFGISALGIGFGIGQVVQSLLLWSCFRRA